MIPGIVQSQLQMASAVGGGGGGGGGGADVELLLHFEGTDGDTTTTDSSANNTPVGFSQTEIDDSQFVFGGTSARLLSSISFIGCDCFIPATDTFELSLRFRVSALSGVMYVFSQGNSSTNRIAVSYETSTGNLYLLIRDVSTQLIVIENPLSVDTWYALRITRVGDVFYAFLDGILKTTYTASTSFPIVSTAPYSLKLGAEYYVGSALSKGGGKHGSTRRSLE